MPEPEVLDVNITVLPANQSMQLVNPRAKFDALAEQGILRQPLTYGQGVLIDTTSGTGLASFQVDSMPSQKTVILSPLRVEVHDRSGNWQSAIGTLPRLMLGVLDSFEIHDLKGLGVNYEATYRLGDTEGPAAKVIGERLVQQEINLPASVSLTGASTKLYLRDDEGQSYTLTIEPRFSELTSRIVFLACNVEITTTEIPPLDKMASMLQMGRDLLEQIITRLFPQTVDRADSDH